MIGSAGRQVIGCALAERHARKCVLILLRPGLCRKRVPVIFNNMDSDIHNNLVAKHGYDSEATTADFRETDSRKCPIAGAHQTWSSFKKDLAFWKIQCSLDKSTIAAHVVNRGFARNAKFMSYKPLLEPDKLGKEEGYDYLVQTIDDMTETQNL